MNSWDYIVQEHLAEIQREIHHIRLVKSVSKSRPVLLEFTQHLLLRFRKMNLRLFQSTADNTNASSAVITQDLTALCNCPCC
jgi:hypothetical protein